MESPSEVGRTELEHPARARSDARKMVFVIVASRKEVPYYDRHSARNVKATGVSLTHPGKFLQTSISVFKSGAIRPTSIYCRMSCGVRP